MAAFKLNIADLIFVLKQIKIAEAHSGGTPLTEIWIDANGNVVPAGTPGATLAIPSPMAPFGLRTVDGSFNNIVPGRETWGAADQPMPRLLPSYYRNEADGETFDANGPAPGGVVSNTNYANNGSVVDNDPRMISNLVSDMSFNNPAAIVAALSFAEFNGDWAGEIYGPNGALETIQNAFAAMRAVLDNPSSTTQQELDARAAFDAVLATYSVEHNGASISIPNIAPDEGLSVPFNAWMTFFGQFFDHGLDLINKGGNGTVYIPLSPDDPLMTRGADGIAGTGDELSLPQNAHLAFMAVTRATPSGDTEVNQTTPFVDQNQTYTSNPSHQVFLREYKLVNDRPLATGHLLDGSDTNETVSSLPTWGDVKAQALNLLGIRLTDLDVGNVPVLRVDPYGEFVRGPNGMPQILAGVDSAGQSIWVETSLANPINPSAIQLPVGTVLINGNTIEAGETVSAVRTGHAFLDDIAHSAAPVVVGGALVADADTAVGNAVPINPLTGQRLAYDNELLDQHFITGDGRGNENIGLTTVHHVFHSEHNRQVEQQKLTVLSSGDEAFINEWLATDVDFSNAQLALFKTMTVAQLNAYMQTTGANFNWDGERLFQAARMATEMQYQHLVFEEFARKIQPLIDPFVFNTTPDINPAIFSEFANVVYRFGHSMLTDNMPRLNGSGAEIPAMKADGTPMTAEEFGLVASFLNPVSFDNNGGLTDDQGAAAIIRGMTIERGNEIDEFLVDALRNNLLGLPLDLGAINIARGRDTGMPSLNQTRQALFDASGSTFLEPYDNWVDFAANLKNPVSVINFIAAYGTHTSITSATTAEAKRDAAWLLVMGGAGAPADRMDFLTATGAYTNKGGLNEIDLWIGGLAEKKMPFGGMLGSTFNAVFELQLENLQDGDRFYYLTRTQGQNFLTSLEQNSFAKMMMANTDLAQPGADGIRGTPDDVIDRHIGVDSFGVYDYVLEVNIANQVDYTLASPAELNAAEQAVTSAEAAYSDAVAASNLADANAASAATSATAAQTSADATDAVALRATANAAAATAAATNTTAALNTLLAAVAAAGASDAAALQAAANAAQTAADATDAVALQAQATAALAADAAAAAAQSAASATDAVALQAAAAAALAIANATNALDLQAQADAAVAADAAAVAAQAAADAINPAALQAAAIAAQAIADATNAVDLQAAANSAAADDAAAAAAQAIADATDAVDLQAQADAAVAADAAAVSAANAAALATAGALALQAEADAAVAADEAAAAVQAVADLTNAPTLQTLADAAALADANAASAQDAALLAQNAVLTAQTDLQTAQAALDALIAAAAPPADIATATATRDQRQVDYNNAVTASAAADQAYLDAQVIADGTDFGLLQADADSALADDQVAAVFQAEAALTDAVALQTSADAAAANAAALQLAADAALVTANATDAVVLQTQATAALAADTAAAAAQATAAATDAVALQAQATAAADADAAALAAQALAADAVAADAAADAAALAAQALANATDAVALQQQADAAVAADLAAALAQTAADDAAALDAAAAAAQALADATNAATLQTQADAAVASDAAAVAAQAAVAAAVAADANLTTAINGFIAAVATDQAADATAVSTDAAADAAEVLDAAASAAQTASATAAAAAAAAAATEIAALAARDTAIAARDLLVAEGNAPGKDPVGNNPVLEAAGLGKVIRDNLSTPGADTNYLRFQGGEHVVVGGTNGDDTIITDFGDDGIWGDAGNDRIESGAGVDLVNGGSGNDVITDSGDSFDFLKGDEGDDVILGGNGIDIYMGGNDNDVVIHGVDSSETFAGQGNDFVLGGDGQDLILGNEGDDWLEGGAGFDTTAGDNSELFFDSRIIGHDVMFSGSEEHDFDAESGDDIMVQGESVLRSEGMFGFDWATYDGNGQNADVDLARPIFTTEVQDVLRDRFDKVEAASGYTGNDMLVGDSRVYDANAIANNITGTAEGVFFRDDINASGIARIDGLNEIITENLMFSGVYTSEFGDLNPNVTPELIFAGGNVLIGGAGDDVMVGKGGNDILDGDKWLNVRIRITQPGQANTAANQIATIDSLKHVFTAQDAGHPSWIGRSLSDLLVDRVIVPNQMHIVREILDAGAAGNLPGTGLDTAVFWDTLENYTVTVANDGTITVAHTGFAAANLPPALQAQGFNAVSDGVDTLRNIEQLRFGDGLGGFQTFQVGQLVPFAATGAPVISDTTPLQGQALTVDTSTIADINGLGAFSFQWQSSVNGTTWTNIAGATSAAFSVPDAAGTAIGPLAGQFLRVTVTFTDGFGDVETLNSAATSAVGINYTAEGSAVGVTFSGRAGDDVLIGSAQNDTLTGLAGADRLVGGAGVDALLGGNGDDVLVGGVGDDTLTGGAGADRAEFTGGVLDYTIRQVGTDVLVGDTVGADGNDTVRTVEVLRFGTTDYNVMTGTGGANTLNGTANADIIMGAAGNDTINAGGGDDFISQTAVSDGRDFIDGGAGVDTYTLHGVGGGAETFRIYTRDAWDAIAGNNINSLNANTEIVITRDGTNFASVIAQLDNIEEIRVNSLNTTANNGNNATAPDGGSSIGDTIVVIGDFTSTSLDYNTIRVQGTPGNDTVDITGLTSAHRLVFESNGGLDTLLGQMRDQDVFSGAGLNDQRIGVISQSTVGLTQIPGGVDLADIGTTDISLALVAVGTEHSGFGASDGLFAGLNRQAMREMLADHVGITLGNPHRVAFGVNEAQDLTEFVLRTDLSWSSHDLGRTMVEQLGQDIQPLDMVDPINAPVDNSGRVAFDLRHLAPTQYETLLG